MYSFWSQASQVSVTHSLHDWQKKKLNTLPNLKALSPLNIELILVYGYNMFRNLFGSRARGDNTERSDIDIAVYGVDGADTGSPREILQLGYKIGFVSDSSVWLLMLKKRNTSVHIYNEDEIDEMIVLIRDSFIPAFIALEQTLITKLQEAEDDWK